jgi:hypothetical protein
MSSQKQDFKALSLSAILFHGFDIAFKAFPDLLLFLSLL